MKKARDLDAVDEWGCHHQCQLVCHAYDDHYRPIEKIGKDAVQVQAPVRP